jgi:hypothetical protein
MGKLLSAYKTWSIKTGAIIILLSLITLAFAPSINANNQPDLENDLIEITTEICGIHDRHPTIIKLTQEEGKEVEELFKNIKQRLDSVESNQEAKTIINWAIFQLDKYGLLGEFSVPQAQQLITKRYQIQRAITDSIFQKELTIDKNFCCLVAGCTSITVVMTPRALFLYFLSRTNALTENTTSLLNKLFFMSLEVSTFFVPILFFDTIFFGGKNNQEPFPHHVSAEGWVSSFGLLGRKNWNGSFYGGLPFPSLTMQLSQWEVYPGISGMIGFKWSGLTSSEVFFIGSTPWIRISPSPP